MKGASIKVKGKDFIEDFYKVIKKFNNQLLKLSAECPYSYLRINLACADWINISTDNRPRPERKANKACYGCNICSRMSACCEKAIEYCCKIIAMNGKNAIFYGRRGDFYDLTQRHDEAIADYTKAIELDPDKHKRDSKWYFSYAIYFIERGCSDYDKKYWNKYLGLGGAIAYCSKAIELEPQNVEYYVTRGELYIDIKKYEEAIFDFSKCFELGDLNSLLIRGLIYLKTKQYQKATEDFALAIKSIDYNRAVYKDYSFVYSEGVWKPIMSGWIYVQSGKAHFALQQYTKAIAHFENYFVYTKKIYGYDKFYSETTLHKKALMDVNKWEKYRKMTWEELIEAIDSGDQEASAYEYIERCNDEGNSPLGGSIISYLYGYDDED